MKRSKSAVVAGLLAIGALSVAGSGAAKTRYVPMTFRDTSGIRPYVPVKINGKPFLFMVHANAALMAMTIHANAAAAGIADLSGHRAGFGITSAGKPSELGYDKGVADTFDVGGFVLHDMPMGVFEIPQEVPVNGMIGIQWLMAAKAFIDFDRERLAVPENDHDAQRERRRLLAHGYTAVPMVWDKAESVYTVHANVNGVTGKFNVSTVAGVIFDEKFVRRLNVSLELQDQKFGGPTGTTGAEYSVNSPFSVSVLGVKLAMSKAISYDIYAYGNYKRPEREEDQVAGYLGAEFMQAGHAVIDFGSGTLYLRPDRK